MLLEPLLGYKSTWRVFSLLSETPRKPVSRKELLRLTKLGNAPLTRALERLEEADIVVWEKRGNKDFYYLQERNQYTQLLGGLWKSEQKSLRNLPYELRVVLSEFLRSLRETGSVQEVILFYSHAKGTATVHSDIDLAVVSDAVSEIQVSRIVKRIEQQFSARIQVHFFLLQSFSTERKLVREIKEDGI